MPDDEIAGLSVVVKAEVEQATKALTNLSRQFENTAMVAQEGTAIQEASFVEVERGMDHNLKQHKKHSEGVMGALKKIGLAWTAITGAATAGIYGLLRASSYGSLYFGQWGAITKDIANTAIKPLIPTLNDATNAYKRFADNLKEKGVWDALKISILDAIDWFNNLDLGLQVLIATLAVLTGVTGIAAVIAAVSALAPAIYAVIAVLTGPVGLVLAVAAVIAIFASWWSKTEDGKRVINDLKNAWDTFKNDVEDVGYLTAAKNALSNFIDWIFSPEQWVIKDSPLDHFLRFFTEDIPNAVDDMIAYIGGITWPSIPNPFDIDWCAYIPGWVAGILGICEDKKKTDWTITWPEISNPFEGIFDPITDFTSEAATYGGNLIDNLVSGINTGMPSLEDAVSGITDTLSGIGSGGSGSAGGDASGSTGGGAGGGAGTGHWVPRDLTNAQKRALSGQYMAGNITYDEYYQATHEWVGSGGAGEVERPEWRKVITRVGCGYASHGNYVCSADYREADEQYASEFGKTSAKTLAEAQSAMMSAIAGMYMLQSVFNSLTEEQQQMFMDRHGGLVDDTSLEVTTQYAQGGYVPSTSPALVHAGEYVVPRGGTLVKEGGLPNVTINLTVNNGTQRDSKALADDISRIISTEIRRLVKA